jgi:hypothetical protein
LFTSKAQAVSGRLAAEHFVQMPEAIVNVEEVAGFKTQSGNTRLVRDEDGRE